MASPDFYLKGGKDWPAFEQQLKAARERVPKLYERWEELERIKSGGS